MMPRSILVVGSCPVQGARCGGDVEPWYDDDASDDGVDDTLEQMMQMMQMMRVHC